MHTPAEVDRERERERERESEREREREREREKNLDKRGEGQNSRPYYFLCTPPHRRRPATLHATFLFHSVAAHQVPPQRHFFIFFCFSFCSGDDYTPVDGAGRHLCFYSCVIDALRRCGAAAAVCFALDIYTKIGYISWFIGIKKLYIKSDIQHRL